MENSKRSFLKIGGLCALGMGAFPAVSAIAKSDLPKAIVGPEALVGKKWAMVVDMKKCWEKGKKDCKDCILACHKAHNVPEIDSIKEEIKWIWAVHYENAFPGSEHAYEPEALKEKPYLVLCNHCTNPPCVRVCPTKATFKRPQDGIVMMDMHRCIGCRYCMAACPYGARSFNFRDPRPYIQLTKEGKFPNEKFPTRERGVVEKCNFCYERLAVGQMPACVEACKCGALCFGDLEDPKSDVRKILADRKSIQRKPELGTSPNVYYLV